MPLFYHPLIGGGNLMLSPDDSRHAVKVLRMRAGDLIHITDGAGKYCEARISDANPQACAVAIVSAQNIPRHDYRLHIAIAPTKNIDRTEWFVEKATELGVDEISFVDCQKSERRTVNLDRFQKLAVSAMKQSGQSWLPVINAIQPLQNILRVSAQQKLIAIVDSANTQLLKSMLTPKGSYLILIGPEGDFSPEELNGAIASGFQKINLGPNTLRTETAGLAACLTAAVINS